MTLADVRFLQVERLLPEFSGVTRLRVIAIVLECAEVRHGLGVIADRSAGILRGTQVEEVCSDKPCETGVP
jgi:hypothetical protein